MVALVQYITDEHRQYESDGAADVGRPSRSAAAKQKQAAGKNEANRPKVRGTEHMFPGDTWSSLIVETPICSVELVADAEQEDEIIDKIQTKGELAGKPHGYYMCPTDELVSSMMYTSAKALVMIVDVAGTRSAWDHPKWLRIKANKPDKAHCQFHSVILRGSNSGWRHPKVVLFVNLGDVKAIPKPTLDPIKHEVACNYDSLVQGRICRIDVENEDRLWKQLAEDPKPTLEKIVKEYVHDYDHLAFSFRREQSVRLKS